MSIMKLKFDLSEFVNVETQQMVTYNLVNRVKARRKESKLTQKQLAERSGVSYASIRRFEQTGDISLFSLLRIAHVLKCRSDFNLLFETPTIINLKDYKT